MGNTGAVRKGEAYVLHMTQAGGEKYVFNMFVCFRDAKCGKIQCLTSTDNPTENNAVSIPTSVTVGNKKIQCKGTHVYKDEQEDKGDTLDPGLVMTGTKCGDQSVRCFL